MDQEKSKGNNNNNTKTKKKKAAVLSSAVLRQTSINSMRAHRRQPHPARPSASPPASPPVSGFHFPFAPSVARCSLVLALVSEDEPCGCWWLSLGLTPVTAPDNNPHPSLPPPPPLLSSEWRSAHQTLMSFTLQSCWLLCYGYMHSDKHFQTYAHIHRAYKQADGSFFVFFFKF